MEATAHLQKIISDLFEAKKFFDLKLTEAQDNLSSKDEDDDDYDEVDENVNSLEEIVSDCDDLILKIKESFDLEDNEESKEQL